MEYGSVLDVAVGTNLVQLDVTSGDCAIPNAGSLMYFHVADNGGRGGDKSSWGEVGGWPKAMGGGASWSRIGHEIMWGWVRDRPEIDLI